MRLIDVVLVFAILIPMTFATTHTLCYNYFLTKDHCVFSAADGRHRCPAPQKTATGVQAIQYPSARSMKRHIGPVLEPRYDTTQPTGRKLGKGLCGPYDDRQPGACLWVGKPPTASLTPLESAGWLNKYKSSNCGKQLYVQKKGDPAGVIFIPVVDACEFPPDIESNGCFQIGLTAKSFLDLKPNADELRSGTIAIVTWDFDNITGGHPKNGPV